MTLTVRLDDATSNRLTRLSKITNRPKSFYVKKALLDHLEELEDIYIAEHRIENASERIPLGKVTKK